MEHTRKEIIVKALSMQLIPDKDEVDVISMLTHALDPSTLNVYRAEFKRFFEFAQQRNLVWYHPIALAEYRDDMLNVNNIPNKKRYNSATINKSMAAVKSVVDNLCEVDFFGENSGQITFKFSKVRGVKSTDEENRNRARKKTWLSKEQMRQLADSPSETTLVGIRDRALLELMGSCGLRASEAASLERWQLTWESEKAGPKLHIFGKADGEFGAYTYPSEKAYDRIMLWYEKRKEYQPKLADIDAVFPPYDLKEKKFGEVAMTRLGVNNLIRKYAKRCGLGTIKSHDLRRFTANTLIEKDKSGEDARDVLRHKDVNMTKMNYTRHGGKEGVTNNLF